MASQASINSHTTLSDFSTALLRANNKDHNSQFKGDKSVNILFNDYASPANSNLSSLLSQIQDDGPAYTDSVRQDSFFNRTKSNDHKVSGKPRSKKLDGDNAFPGSSAELPQDRAQSTDIAETKTSVGAWILFLLMLTVGILSVLTLFKLDLRTSELEETINSYDGSLQDSIVSQTQSKDLSLSITNTNEKLQSIQQDLQHIKNDYKVLDEKYTGSMVNRVSPQADEVVIIEDSVDVLRHEILALKSELQTVKNKLITINKNRKLSDKTVLSSGLTVNLASLTNKDKAEKVVEQLQDTGLFPFIQPLVVKGRQIYRLSVNGFSSREEAELFIQRAGEQYGLKDGWISQS